MTDAGSPLVKKLIQIQRREHLSDEQMAERLGVTRPLWSNLRNGKALPGGKALAGIVRGFPELSAEVLIFLGSPEEETITEVA